MVGEEDVAPSMSSSIPVGHLAHSVLILSGAWGSETSKKPFKMSSPHSVLLKWHLCGSGSIVRVAEKDGFAALFMKKASSRMQAGPSSELSK